MKTAMHSLLLAVTMMLPVCSHAYPLTNLAVSGALPDGGTATGSLTIDDASGYLYTNNIVINDHAFAYTFIGSFFEDPYPLINPTEFYSVSYDLAGDSLLLAFPVGLLTNFTGGPLCSNTQTCAGIFTSQFSAQSGGGTLTTQTFDSLVASSVPEPSTIMLTLTGIVFLGLQLATHGSRLADWNVISERT